MRLCLQYIGVLIILALLIWGMRYVFGAPICEDSPLFMRQGTTLDCAMQP